MRAYGDYVYFLPKVKESQKQGLSEAERVLWWRNFQLEYWRTFQLVSTLYEYLFSEEERRKWNDEKAV